VKSVAESSRLPPISNPDVTYPMVSPV